MTDSPSYDLEAERARLMAHLLRHVPFDGWSGRALEAAAAAAGMPVGEARLLFPGGGLDMVVWFQADGDRKMEAILAQHDLPALKIRQRVALGVRERLCRDQDHREAVRRAVGLMALPANVPAALKCGYRTVDAIWRAVGDTSTDFNFYTKRALLHGVYASTLLYWLNDESPEFSESWAFLDRRIENVMAIQKGKGKLRKIVRDLAERFSVPG